MVPGLLHIFYILQIPKFFMQDIKRFGNPLTTVFRGAKFLTLDIIASTLFFIFQSPTHHIFMQGIQAHCGEPRMKVRHGRLLIYQFQTL